MIGLFGQLEIFVIRMFLQFGAAGYFRTFDNFAIWPFGQCDRCDQNGNVGSFWPFGDLTIWFIWPLATWVIWSLGHLIIWPISHFGYF